RHKRLLNSVSKLKLILNAKRLLSFSLNGPDKKRVRDDDKKQHCHASEPNTGAGRQFFQVIARHQERNYIRKPCPDRNLQQTHIQVVTELQAHSYMEIHQSDHAAENCIQNHNDMRHAAKIHQVSKETRNCKKAKHSRIERPQTPERNSFVVLQPFRFDLVRRFTEEGVHKQARYQSPKQKAAVEQPLTADWAIAHFRLDVNPPSF